MNDSFSCDLFEQAGNAHTADKPESSEMEWLSHLMNGGTELVYIRMAIKHTVNHA